MKSMSISDQTTLGMDTGSTLHLASDTTLLKFVSDKSKINLVLGGNGSPISITHIGHTNFSTNHHCLHLHNVLVAPDTKKNLIYVHKFSNLLGSSKV